MNRPPEPSRRRFLAGTATLVGSAALAGCTTAYGALPDRVVHARTRRRSVPEIPPAVEATEDHLEELADEIERYAEKGLDAWDRMERLERRVGHHRSGLERAAEFVADLPSKPATADTAQSARGHLWLAAGAYAYAAARNGEFDRDPTDGVDEGLDEAASLRDAFTYETGDPKTFLAYGSLVESELRGARSLLSRRRDAELDSVSGTTNSAEEVGNIHRDVQQNRMRVRSAASYREVLRERDPLGDATPFRESMADSRDRFAERIERLNDEREEWIDRTGEFDGERLSVHSALYSRSHLGRGEAVFWEVDRLVDAGYEVDGTVELATRWLVLDATDGERNRIEDAGEDTLDATAIDAAKRDAVDRLEAVLAGDPDPLTLFLADEARWRLSYADSSIERRSSDDEDWEWDRANAYAQYLLAKGVCERIPETVDLLAEE